MSFQEYIHSVIAEYAPVLRLQHFTFEVEKVEKKYMECHFCYPYLSATVRYGEEAEKDYDHGKPMAHIIVHELCHLITDPLYSRAFDRFTTESALEDERERVTDHVAKVVFALYKKCWV